jgi:hypothetical protein
MESCISDRAANRAQRALKERTSSGASTALLAAKTSTPEGPHAAEWF